MKKDNYAQLELFSQMKDLDNKKMQNSNLFFNYIRAYEKTLLFIIGIITCGVISFSLGIEKGKRLAAKNKIIESKDTAIYQPYQPKEIQPAIKKEGVSSQSKPKEYKQNYTIQLASFLTKTHAQKEAEALKKRGISIIVLTKGKYTVICAGNFSDKKTAESLLSEFKKRYQDCFLRRL